MYVPATPSTPLLRSQGEVEITASVRPQGSLETSAAWVPAEHVLLTVEGSLQQSDGSETRNGTTTDFQNLHKQAGVGVGTYHLLGADKSVYLGAVAGFGLASASIYDNHFNPFDFLFGGADQLAHYQATYQRYYGQLYVAKTTPLLSYGASLRTTFVHYSELTRNDVPISSPTKFYVEPTFFTRIGRGAWQGQATLGFSQPNTLDRNSPDHRNVSPANLITSVGVVLRPHLLGHRATKVPAE
ncbi:hypothetical protein GCM10027594_32060 [Hymenobacter agri]